MNAIDQRGHRIIRRPRIFHGLTGCQPDPRVGASQVELFSSMLEVMSSIPINNNNVCYYLKVGKNV